MDNEMENKEEKIKFRIEGITNIIIHALEDLYYLGFRDGIREAKTLYMDGEKENYANKKEF